MIRKCKQAAMALLFLHLSTSAFAATFDVLGKVNHPSFSGSSVVVSDDGATVLCTRSSGGPYLAFLWTASDGRVKEFSIEDGQLQPEGISGDGKIIVGWNYPGNGSIFHDASFDGNVKVGALGPMAIRMVGNQTRNLGSLPDSELGSRALAISSDGDTIVGVTRNEAGFQPFRWTEQEGMMRLGQFAGASSPNGTAWDVSADGTVVGDLLSGPPLSEAFRWTKSTGLQGLGDLEGGRLQSTAYAISADGKTIVGTSNADGTSRNDAFIWDVTNGMQKLADILVEDYGMDLQGLRLESATGISADGRVIVGVGLGPSDLGGIESFAWRADLGPIPEPSSEILLLIAAATILATRR